MHKPLPWCMGQWCHSVTCHYDTTFEFSPEEGTLVASHSHSFYHPFLWRESGSECLVSVLTEQDCHLQVLKYLSLGTPEKDIFTLVALHLPVFLLWRLPFEREEMGTRCHQCLLERSLRAVMHPRCSSLGRCLLVCTLVPPLSSFCTTSSLDSKYSTNLYLLWL